MAYKNKACIDSLEKDIEIVKSNYSKILQSLGDEKYIDWESTMFRFGINPKTGKMGSQSNRKYALVGAVCRPEESSSYFFKSRGPRLTKRAKQNIDHTMYKLVYSYFIGNINPDMKKSKESLVEEALENRSIVSWNLEHLEEIVGYMCRAVGRKSSSLNIYVNPKTGKFFDNDSKHIENIVLQTNKGKLSMYEETVMEDRARENISNTFYIFTEKCL